MRAIQFTPKMPEQELIDIHGKVKLLPAAEWQNLTQQEILTFCRNKARYGLPNIELIEFLKKEIAGLETIEIGAGHGDFGTHLGIPMTDSYMQLRPDVKLHYERLQQPTIEYGKDVIRYDALEALQRYKPQCVFGSWITQWIDPNKPFVKEGSMYGVKENLLLKKVKKYILISNLDVCRDKEILKLPHRCLELPFLFGRTFDQSKNRIFIWES